MPVYFRQAQCSGISSFGRGDFQSPGTRVNSDDSHPLRTPRVSIIRFPGSTRALETNDEPFIFKAHPRQEAEYYDMPFPTALTAPKEQKHKAGFQSAPERGLRYPLSDPSGRGEPALRSGPAELPPLRSPGLPGAPRTSPGPGERIPRGQRSPPSQLAAVREAWMTRVLKKKKKKKSKKIKKCKRIQAKRSPRREEGCPAAYLAPRAPGAPPGAGGGIPQCWQGLLGLPRALRGRQSHGETFVLVAPSRGGLCSTFSAPHHRPPRHGEGWGWKNHGEGISLLPPGDAKPPSERRGELLGPAGGAGGAGGKQGGGARKAEPALPSPRSNPRLHASCRRPPVSAAVRGGGEAGGHGRSRPEHAGRSRTLPTLPSPPPGDSHTPSVRHG